MPLDFLKRRGNQDDEAAPAATPPASSVLPEEIVAQEYQLKLYFAGKSSEGVRMKAGPSAMNELPSIAAGESREAGMRALRQAVRDRPQAVVSPQIWRAAVKIAVGPKVVRSLRHLRP